MFVYPFVLAMLAVLNQDLSNRIRTTSSCLLLGEIYEEKLWSPLDSSTLGIWYLNSCEVSLNYFEDARAAILILCTRLFNDRRSNQRI